MIYKGYMDKNGNKITLKEYNRYAQQAHRKGVRVQHYLESIGYTKLWGRGRDQAWKYYLQNMDTAVKLNERYQKG